MFTRTKGSEIMNIELLKELLIIAIASGVIMTLFVQKIKESFTFKKGNRVVFISFFTNMVLGTLFAISFSNANLINAIWVGFFSFVGADTIYKVLEDKVFKSIKELEKEEEIEYDL